MMNDRLNQSVDLMKQTSSIFIHIDEHEISLFTKLCNDIFLSSNELGTIVWDKRNPKGVVAGVAYQHEYIEAFAKNKEQFALIPFTKKKKNAVSMIDYVKSLIKKHGCVNEDVRSEYKKWIKDNDDALSGGEKAYNLIDDNGRIYQPVSMAAPDKPETRSHRPLIHPVSGKECPVPAKGWRYTDDSMDELVLSDKIAFGVDETTQPRQKYYLDENMEEAFSSMIYYGGAGDTLGYSFENSKPVYVAKQILLSVCKDDNIVMDFFAGSGTTGHAVLELNREDKNNRTYILVEMGSYFDSVTKPRMQKVIYSADWKNGKPQSRNTGVSHIMKYMKLESYEDALSNISLDNEKHGLSSLFGDDYLINYMLDIEAEGSLLDIDAFRTPFEYKLKVTENNETKEKNVDIAETFNYLIGLTVKTASAITYFNAVKDENGEYEGAVRLVKDIGGTYGFKQIEGTTPDGKRVLVIWRTISDNLIESNAALDAYFSKNRINPQDREYDIIYVNGDNNLQNISTAEDSFKVKMTELEFKKRMFEEE